MPANGRWYLFRRLKVNEYSIQTIIKGQICEYRKICFLWFE